MIISYTEMVVYVHIISQNSPFLETRVRVSSCECTVAHCTVQNLVYCPSKTAWNKYELQKKLTF